LHIPKLLPIFATKNNKHKQEETTMKTKLFFLSALLLAMLGVCGCSGDDDETSINPKDRIVGKWKLVRQGTNDISSSNIYYTFSKRGELTMHNVPVRKDLESETYISDITIPIAFEDDWEHNETTNELHGHFATKSDSENEKPTRYSCIIGVKEMMIVQEYPDNWTFFLDPRLFFERQ
jgi:hypothetical protein